ncbi:MAG: bifunctional glutamate N-acetyltransferase/amino-acid acetyltransferase ArgJ [candidate division NC10 bacterium]|nr:bifunctional glutamate N-acetyltransferase/amino-acid acetyltransferase ArgJ [candidate division NC10 bacterium]
MADHHFRPVASGLAAVQGLKATGLACGIKTTGKLDLALVVTDRPATVAATFTTNRVQAAPVQLSRRHLRGGRLAAIVLNSGNANACTGARGFQDAEATAAEVAEALGCPLRQVFVASTGVIGRPLPMANIRAGIREAATQLSRRGARLAAQAILTTDSRPKEAGVSFDLAGRRVTVAGFCKGAGMIAPRMATMLAVIATDATLSSRLLHRAIKTAVAESFNRITVDGDTSTNDTVLCFATAAANAPAIAAGTGAFRTFQAALTHTCRSLARMIALDGEGATKLAAVRLCGARSAAEAARAARTVAESPLVKTTLYGEDMNWGRIMAALGRSGAGFDPETVDIAVDGLPVVRRGLSLGPAAEARANRRLRQREFALEIDLGAGRGEAEIWTTDLTEEYVRINAGYRT